MEGAFCAIECRLVQMNVFSHYCLTFSANNCVFSLNEQQKVYYGERSEQKRNTIASHYKQEVDDLIVWDFSRDF